MRAARHSQPRRLGADQRRHVRIHFAPARTGRIAVHAAPAFLPQAPLLDEQIRHHDVDVFLAGIAGRRFTDSYWPRILGALRPRVVLASHFDDFFRPLDAPAGFSLNVNLAALPEEITAVSSDFTTAALPPFTTIASGASRSTRETVT